MDVFCPKNDKGDVTGCKEGPFPNISWAHNLNIIKLNVAYLYKFVTRSQFCTRRNGKDCRLVHVLSCDLIGQL